MREQPGEDTKERLRKALQHFKILPQTSDRQQMTEEERYIDYGFEHRVTAVKGIYNNGLLLWDCVDKCHELGDQRNQFLRHCYFISVCKSFFFFNFPFLAYKFVTQSKYIKKLNRNRDKRRAVRIKFGRPFTIKMGLCINRSSVFDYMTAVERLF